MGQEYKPKRFQDGATVVEYVLIVSFIAIAVVITVALLGSELDNYYQRIVACVESSGSNCQ